MIVVTVAMATFRFGSCELDVDARQLSRNGQPVHLSPKAFEMLKILVSERPRAISKAELLERIWPGTFVTDDSLAKIVTQARAAIGDDATMPTLLRTIHAFGYAFSGVAAAGGEPAPRSARASVWLVVEGRAVMLVEGENIVGRDPAGRVALDSVRVSRRHARVTVTGAAAVLDDLGSRNGTSVNGARLSKPVVLADGDQITVGGFTLAFRSAAEFLTTED